MINEPNPINKLVGSNLIKKMQKSSSIEEPTFYQS